MLSRCNLIHDVGYLEYGNTSSLEMLTIADELIAMARYFTAGIEVNRDTLALEALERVKHAGAKGIFLTDDHTFDHFESALFMPGLLDRARYDTWQGEGGHDLYRRSNDKARRTLSEHELVPQKDDKLIKEIDKLLNKIK
jgi:trimethylamine--corrinoid protein Co-methyltransferase